jgi:hypothetical protein
MTPYELRFQIFCQAQAHVLEEYHSKLEGQKDTDPQVPFPSYEEIETLARKIKNFVVDS